MQMPEMKSLAARNPLSIIALFISLIYGISALLLGASVDRLMPQNQDRLIWFIILFPVAVLGAFLLLVIGHHKKLYAPGDFRSDEGFLAGSTPPAAIGMKYLSADDVLADADTAAAHDQDPAPAYVDDAPTLEIAEDGSPRLPPVPAHVESRPDPRPATPLASQRYLLEGLVFQELQTAFGSAISREIQLSVGNGRYLGVDGWIDTPPTIIEIQTVSNLNNLSDRLSFTISRLDHIAVELKLNTKSEARIILAVLCRKMAMIPQAQMMAGLAAGAARVTVDIRMFAADELVTKYGLQSALPLNEQGSSAP